MFPIDESHIQIINLNKLEMIHIPSGKKAMQTTKL